MYICINPLLNSKMKKIIFGIITLMLLSLASCNSKDDSSIKKEWSVYSSQDNTADYEWEGTLYCLQDGINWKHNSQNEFVSLYLPGGNHWKIERDNIDFIGLGDTIENKAPFSYIEIVTKNQKHYYLRSSSPEENKKIAEYLIDEYMQ